MKLEIIARSISLDATTAFSTKTQALLLSVLTLSHSVNITIIDEPTSIRILWMQIEHARNIKHNIRCLFLIRYVNYRVKIHDLYENYHFPTSNNCFESFIASVFVIHVFFLSIISRVFYQKYVHDHFYASCTNNDKVISTALRCWNDACSTTDLNHLASPVKITTKSPPK